MGSTPLLYGCRVLFNLVLKKILAALVITSGSAASATMFQTSLPLPSNDGENTIEIEVIEKTWKCPTCTPKEQHVLEELQKRTNIRDRNALAAIMGNIKQESGFKAKICEGGAKVPYKQCRYGGYGLIQWTTANRYNNLGKFCKKYDCDPSTIEGQTRFMINESTFQRYLPEFENAGFSIEQYMVPSYYWLGWGIKGNRTHYAYQYAGKLVWTE